MYIGVSTVTNIGCQGTLYPAVANAQNELCALLIFDASLLLAQLFLAIVMFALGVTSGVSLGVIPQIV